MPSQTVEIRSRQVSRQLIITTELLNRFFNHTIAAKNRLWHSDIWMGRSPRCIEFGGYERTFYAYIFFFNFSLFIVNASVARLSISSVLWPRTTDVRKTHRGAYTRREDGAGDGEDRSGPGSAMRTPPVRHGPLPRAFNDHRATPSTLPDVFAGSRNHVGRLAGCLRQQVIFFSVFETIVVFGFFFHAGKNTRVLLDFVQTDDTRRSRFSARSY